MTGLNRKSLGEWIDHLDAYAYWTALGHHKIHANTHCLSVPTGNYRLRLNCTRRRFADVPRYKLLQHKDAYLIPRQIKKPQVWEALFWACVTVIVLTRIQHVYNRVTAVLSRLGCWLKQSLVTSTRPPSIGPGTRARSSAAAAHCEQLAPLKSSRNAASLVAIAVACVACDPQLVRTPTNCDLLNYLAVSNILGTTARCRHDHYRGDITIHLS